MSTSSSKLRGSQQRAGWSASNEAARGALVGLIPLGLLLVAVLVVLALATFSHIDKYRRIFRRATGSCEYSGRRFSGDPYRLYHRDCAHVEAGSSMAAGQFCSVCAHRPVCTRVQCAGCCLTSAACVLPASVSCSVMVP